LLVLGQRAGRALHAAVAVGRVEEVDADLVRVIHDGFGLAGGGQRPEVHGAEAEAAHRQAGTAKVDVFHTANPFMAPRFHSSPAWIARCLATRSRVAQRSEQYRRAAPRPTFTNGRPQDDAAHSPAGGAWRSASSTARARQEEVRNHSAQGASSSPSTCRCQPDSPPWLVSRGGCACPASRRLMRSAAAVTSLAAKT